MIREAIVVARFYYVSLICAVTIFATKIVTRIIVYIAISIFCFLFQGLPRLQFFVEDIINTAVTSQLVIYADFGQLILGIFLPRSPTPKIVGILGNIIVSFIHGTVAAGAFGGAIGAITGAIVWFIGEVAGFFIRITRIRDGPPEIRDHEGAVVVYRPQD